MNCLLCFLFMGFISPSFTQNSNLLYSVSASKGIFNDKVKLTWDAVLEADFYKISRVYDAPKKIKRGKSQPLQEVVIAPSIKETSYTDFTIPFGQHIYYVTALKKDPLYSENKYIEIAKMETTGYRKVTDEEFFLEFQKSIDSSLPRICTMKMLNFVGEKKKGWKQGYLIYKTTGIKKKPFRVIIEYTDFIDQVLSLNGTYEIEIYKLLAQNGLLKGTFYIDGIYQGTVTHNLIINGGKSIGGSYKVQQKGKPMVLLPWNITDHPLEDSKYKNALQKSLKEYK